MVVALYLIALAMIGAGAASMAYGYGIILNERGWTMVISGTVALSSGLLLLGIAVTAGRVKRLQQELAGTREAVSRLPVGIPTRPAPAIAEPAASAFVPPPRLAEASAERDEPEEHAVLKAADAIPEPAPAAAPPRPARSRPNGDRHLQLGRKRICDVLGRLDRSGHAERPLHLPVLGRAQRLHRRRWRAGGP